LFIEQHGKELKFAIENSLSEETIDQIAKHTGFTQRVRKLPAWSFVNTLMFSACNQANTSLPDISADLHQQFAIDISKEALHKKFTPQGVGFLKELIKLQLSQQFTLANDDGLKKHFASINIKDSSKFSLHTTYNDSYPGYGNFSKTNGLMNLKYEYDLLSGRWDSIALTSCKTNDQQNSKETIEQISKAGLYIRDLGYITPTYLKAVIKKEAFFLNRLPSQISIYNFKKEQINWSSIDRKLNKTGVNVLDINALIYKKDMLACRLIIERVTDEEYKKRLNKARNSAKSHKVSLSKNHKIRCRYNTFITNVERKILPAEKIRKTYYLRWQIELVFKTWKSFFEINKVKKVKKERMECQLLAQFLWILLNWSLFNACNRYVSKQNSGKGISVLKFFKRCISFSFTLRQVILKQNNIERWLKTVFLPLIENTACEAKWKKQTHYEIIYALSTPLS